MRACYIVGAGEFHDAYFKPEKEDLVIAADGGYHFLERLGVEPDLVIGDFDSLKPECGFQDKKFIVIELPKEKDDTDILAAIREGMHQDCDVFHIFGGTGGRIDHTLANIQCLNFLSKAGMRGILYGKDFQMTVLTDSTLTLPADRKGILAVFSLGDRAEGVSLKGLKYELSEAVITNDFPIGVSNEHMGKESSIAVEKGTLLVVSYL